jgi:hypothetical protein
MLDVPSRNGASSYLHQCGPDLRLPICPMDNANEPTAMRIQKLSFRKPCKYPPVTAEHIRRVSNDWMIEKDTSLALETESEVSVEVILPHIDLVRTEPKSLTEPSFVDLKVLMSPLKLPHVHDDCALGEFRRWQKLPGHGSRSHMSAQRGADVCADAIDYLETGSIDRLPVLSLSKPVPRGLLGLWRLSRFTAFSTPTSAIRNLWSLGSWRQLVLKLL